MLNQNNNGISSDAVIPQLNYVDVIQQLEQAIALDAKRVQLMMQQGVITNEKGQYILKNLE